MILLLVFTSILCLIILFWFDFVKLFSFSNMFLWDGIFMMFSWFHHVWRCFEMILWLDILWRDLWLFWLSNYFFILGDLFLVFKRYSVEFSVDVQVLEYFGLSCCHTSLGIYFLNEFWYRYMPYGFLGGILGNWGPFSDMRRFSLVDFRVRAWQLMQCFVF